MIKHARARTPGHVRVTFALPSDHLEGPASVVGDFNGWDPLAHPLRRRSNGTNSVAVDLPEEARFRFRYLEDGGRWHTDPDVPAQPNAYGDLDSVIEL